MSGGSYEHIMAVMMNQNNVAVSGSTSTNNSGFNGPYSNATGNNTEGISFPEEKYYDKYTYNTNYTAFNRRILGDATGEMGPFANTTIGPKIRQVGSCYRDESWYIFPLLPWFMRGGQYPMGTSAGIMTFERTEGFEYAYASFRIVLAF